MMLQTEYAIREYQSTDLSSLAEIYSGSIRYHGPAAYSGNQVEAWASFSAGAEFKNWIESATTFVAIARNGAITGFSGLGENGHISALFVAPAYHRLGIATSLLTTALTTARIRGFGQITTHASEFSKPLFEKFGFVLTEVEHTEVKGVEFSRYAMRATV